MSGPEHSTPQPTGAAPARLGWRTAIEQTVTGLGYDLVDVERALRGLLRVYIDRVPGRVYPSGESEFVTVDDCEIVTRQLQYVLEVENVAYERLEVSSPGLDRPLRHAGDYARFSGLEISLTLKLPFQGRKVWKGVLGPAQAAEQNTTEQNDTAADAPAVPSEGWSLVFKEGKTEQVLAFTLEEVRGARSCRSSISRAGAVARRPRHPQEKTEVRSDESRNADVGGRHLSREDGGA